MSRPGKFCLTSWWHLIGHITSPDRSMAEEKSQSVCQTEVNQNSVLSTQHDVNQGRKGETPKLLLISRITSASCLKIWYGYMPGLSGPNQTLSGCDSIVWPESINWDASVESKSCTLIPGGMASKSLASIVFLIYHKILTSLYPNLDQPLLPSYDLLSKTLSKAI